MLIDILNGKGGKKSLLVARTPKWYIPGRSTDSDMHSVTHSDKFSLSVIDSRYEQKVVSE